MKHDVRGRGGILYLSVSFLSGPPFLNINYIYIGHCIGRHLHLCMHADVILVYFIQYHYLGDNCTYNPTTSIGYPYSTIVGIRLRWAFMYAQTPGGVLKN